MRHLIWFGGLWLVLGVFMLAAAAENSALAIAPQRGEIFNGDWRFMRGDDNNAAAIDFADAAWEHIGIPHSFSQPFFMTKHFYVGVGWYRKTFALTRNPEKLYWLEFEGVFQNCVVFVNGKIAGEHHGGYTSFAVDLTPFLIDGNNVIAIRVDNLWNAQLPPRAGEHTFSGGIYRDVYLVTTSKIYLPRNALRVWTKSLTTNNNNATRAELRINYTLKNLTNAAAELPVIFTVTHNGEIIRQITETINVGAANVGENFTRSMQIPHPQLWSPATPTLYTLTVNVDGQDYHTRFGIREFRFDKDEGFFLNGKPLRLRGANRHQDHAGWGDAVTNAAHYRDAQMIKDCGMNFVRGSHYPHDPAFLDACDELGLLVWAENTFWGIGGFGGEGYWTASAYPPNEADQVEFEKNDRRLLAEMINDQFNHPSIIVWSLCNEPFFTEKSAMAKAQAHIARQVETAKELDPTRAVGVGGAQRQGFDKFGDVIGYNGDGAKFPQPDRPSLVAEYGSFVAERPGVYAPTWGDVAGKFPAWRAGEALWCAFHHASIAGDMGKMGMIDYARLPLRQWFWYRNEYANIPPPKWAQNGKPAAVKLRVDKNHLRADGTDDVFCHLQIVDAQGNVISNSPEVTLTVVAGGGVLPTGKSITFKHNTPIDIREGEAATTLRAGHNGEIILAATSDGLQSDRATITAYGAKNAWSPALAATWQKSRPFTPLTAPMNNFSQMNSSNETRDNLAHTRPTRVSSASENQPAANANDGDEKTFWQAATDDAAPWWRVDLENFYAVEQVELFLADAEKISLLIETSLDDTHWENAAGISNEVKFAGNRPQIMNYVHKISPTRARFVRVKFTPTAEPPKIHEIKVSGKMAE